MLKGEASSELSFQFIKFNFNYERLIKIRPWREGLSNWDCLDEKTEASGKVCKQRVMMRNITEPTSGEWEFGLEHQGF